MLARLPECKAVLTAGQLATKVFSDHFGIQVNFRRWEDLWSLTVGTRQLRLYRMPCSVQGLSDGGGEEG